MSKGMFFTRGACVLSAVLFTIASVWSQQKPPDCDGGSREFAAPEYQIGRNAHLRDPNERFFLAVSVESKFFTRASMMALAGELNRRFCAERRIEALIMDDHQAASVWDPIHSPELYQPAERAQYYLDRVTGEEHIEFSTKRGRGSDVFVDLGTKQNQVESRTYSGKYRNHNFGYSAQIPPTLNGVSEVPNALESGILLALSPDRARYIWLGASYNTARFSSLRWATELRLEWLRNEGALIQGVTRRPIRLGRLRAERVIVRYKSPGSDSIRIEDFVIALKPQPDEDGIIYQIEMRTSEASYATDIESFHQIARSWRDTRLPN